MNQSSSSRINTFDLLRGWCLIVILCDHLLRYPSIFDPLTGRGLLWVTAAEGFFFISGTLVGIIRGRRMLAKGLWAPTKELWWRAAKLYIASVVLTFVYYALGSWLIAKGVTNVKGGVEQFGSQWGLIWHVLGIKYSYGWTDFLNFYAVFMLLAPAALWLLRKRLWWLVGGVSVLLWVVKGQPYVHLSPNFLLWQAYFFLGMTFGYHFGSIQAWWQARPKRVRRTLVGTALALTAVTVVASFAFTFGTPLFQKRAAIMARPLAVLHLPPPEVAEKFFYGVKENPTFNALFQNNRSGLLRLPLFFLWFSALFVLVRRYEHKIIHYLGWLLLPLGRNSLYVYIIESVVIFGITLMRIPQQFVVNSVIIMSAIMLCWLCVRQRLLFNIIPR